MLFLLRIILALYFTIGKAVFALTVMLLLLDFLFVQISDGISRPFAKIIGTKGVIFILFVSYFLWPYWVWDITHNWRKKNGN